MKFKGFWYDGLLIGLAAGVSAAFIVMTAFVKPELAVCEAVAFALVCLIAVAERLKNDAIILIIGNSAPMQNIPENIIALGRIENRVDLAKYYSLADLSVITSKRETFSMPVAESLCCGTPVIGFEAGGPESVALDEYSEFVEFGSADKLYECAIKWLNKKATLSEISDNARKYYSKTRMAQAYIELYKKYLDKDESL